MKHAYLPSVIARIERVTEDATQTFAELSPAQLNWKPSPQVWSVGQCLDHLITANRTYFPVFDSILAGTKTPTFWEKIPLLPEWWGKMLIQALDARNAKKSKTFPPFQPTQSEVPATILQDFAAHNTEVIQYFEKLDALDMGQIIITSPAARFVTYSLRDTVYILANHEERHVLQAKNVLALSDFPKVA
ncbi:MAG: DinB family protein [Saprospiraceae bacterium]